MHGPQHVEQRGGGGDGLQAAAVAAAADGAVRAHLHVADLARVAGHATVQAAAEDDPGADPRGDLHVDQMLERRGRCRACARRARRGWRRCRRRPGSAAAARAVRPRRGRASREAAPTSRPCRCGGRSDRAGPCPRRSPGRARGPPARARRARAPRRCRARARPPCRPPPRRCVRRAPWRTDRPPRPAGGGGRSRFRARRRRSARAAAARPAFRGRSAARASDSTTIPLSCRSPSRVVIVVRERPVSRIRSARLALPWWRSASTTRRRLARRSDSREPPVDAPSGP